MAEQEKKPRGITSIAVSGFKSLRDETRIAIRPLTVLAGANSSGKSSIMQPLLMLKQTLDSPNDPGALLINGQNVNFSDPEQLFSVNSEEKQFKVKIEFDDVTLTINYIPTPENIIDIEEVIYTNSDRTMRLSPEMFSEEISAQLQPNIENFRVALEGVSKVNYLWKVVRKRCFLTPQLITVGEDTETQELTAFFDDIPLTDFSLRLIRQSIQNIIHLSGFRGNPERSYPRTSATKRPFIGTFNYYVASVILDWYEQDDYKYPNQLVDHLALLKLTDQLELGLLPTSVELRVGRAISKGGRNIGDTVNIADVGFGVSQVLPVLVALLVAEPGQLVYIEQPELHLHPRAQVALAQVLADAANRGVRVVIETHSDLVLLGIQTLVADKKHPSHISNEDVIFHWFERDEQGCTKVDSTDLDELGRYNNTKWKEDFGDIRLHAQSEYLDAGFDMEEA